MELNSKNIEQTQTTIITKKTITIKNTKMIDKVLTEFRKIYARQLGSDFKVKLASLNKAIANKCTETYTEDVFKREIADRIDLLLSSAHFQEAAIDKGLNPFNAATHFVLLGWQKLEDCILRGGYNNIQNYQEWQQPMFELDTMKMYNPHIKAMLEAIDTSITESNTTSENQQAA